MDRTQSSPSKDPPVAPLFLCEEGEYWIALEPQVAIERNLFRLGSAKKYEFIAANQTKWKMHYEDPEFSFWTRLTQSLRTPKVLARVEWLHLGSYCIDELQGKFLKAGEHDDDVLTQFVERED